jgi:hypothetical protein
MLRDFPSGDSELSQIEGEVPDGAAQRCGGVLSKDPTFVAENVARIVVDDIGLGPFDSVRLSPLSAQGDRDKNRVAGEENLDSRGTRRYGSTSCVSVPQW